MAIEQLDAYTAPSRKDVLSNPSYRYDGKADIVFLHLGMKKESFIKSMFFSQYDFNLRQNFGDNLKVIGKALFKKNKEEGVPEAYGAIIDSQAIPQDIDKNDAWWENAKLWKNPSSQNVAIHVAARNIIAELVSAAIDSVKNKD